MDEYIKARDDAAADATAAIAASRARSALAGRTDADGEAIASGLVGSRKRAGDSLALDAGRTVAINADGTKNPWNARGLPTAGSLSRRGKADKGLRVRSVDAAHTRTSELLAELSAEAERLGYLVACHSPGGSKPSARKRKRFQRQLHGCQAKILNMGGHIAR